MSYSQLMKGHSANQKTRLEASAREMDTLHKLDVLRDIYPEEAELDQVLGKLLEMTLGKYRLRLQRYDRDLREFEEQYGMDSPIFYERFEAGDLGDAMDFFEWAGVYELRQDIGKKIRQLEDAA